MVEETMVVKRTSKEQLDYLDEMEFVAKKERAKLLKRIEAEENKQRNNKKKKQTK